MAQAGYTKKIYVKATASTAYSELPGTDATLNKTTDMLDATTFKSSGLRRRIYGIKDWNVSGSALLEASDAGLAVLRAAYANRTRVNVRYDESGAGTGEGGTGLLENFSQQSGVSDLENISFSIQGDGAISTY